MHPFLTRAWCCNISLSMNLTDFQEPMGILCLIVTFCVMPNLLICFFLAGCKATIFFKAPESAININWVFLDQIASEWGVCREDSALVKPCMLCDPAELINKLKLKDVSSFPEDTGSSGVCYWLSTGTLNILYYLSLVDIIKNQQISSTGNIRLFLVKIYSFQLWLNAY